MAKTYDEAKGRSSKWAIAAEWRGMDETAKVFEKLPQKIASRVLKPAVAKAAKPGIKKMRTNLPKTLPNTAYDVRPADPYLKKVRQSIGVKTKIYRNTGTATAIIGARGTVPDAGGKWDSPYHMGTVSAAYIATAIDQGFKLKPPVPFIRQTKEQIKSQVNQDLKKHLFDGIERETMKLSRKAQTGGKLSSSEVEALQILS